MAGILKNEDGICCGAECRDVEDLESGSFHVRAKVVINATGPFSDGLCQMDEPGIEFQSPDKKLIKPAAGTHVVLPDHFSPDRTGLAILKTQDNRAMFYLPWQGQTLVGTTDYQVDIDEWYKNPVPPMKDVMQILDEVNRYLDPSVACAELKDVRAAWCGVRPLAYGTESMTGTKIPKKSPRDHVTPKIGEVADTKKVSREHVILVSNSKMVTIAGGKWTSYRHMGEDVINKAIEVGQLNENLQASNDRKLQKGDSARDGHIRFKMGLVGSPAGANVPYTDLKMATSASFHPLVVQLRQQGLPRDVAECLASNYGTNAVKVASLNLDGNPKRLAQGYPWVEEQVVWACRHECARRIEDVLCRRTRLAQVDVIAACDAVSVISKIMQVELQWPEDLRKREVKNARVFLDSCGASIVQASK